MRNLKNCGLLAVILAIILTSCLGDGNYRIDEWYLKNAQIASLTLSSDSIAGLSEVIFTIDQMNGKIFNQDSMPFGTMIDEKVLCNMTFEVGTSGVQLMQQATGDTIFWNGTDSIDFSQPVMFKIYAVDGETTKTYEAQINIHQVNPDSMVWSKFLTIAEGRVFDEMKTMATANLYGVFVRENGAAKLFTSETLVLEFQETALTGFPEDAVFSSITEYDTNFFVITENGEAYTANNWTTWHPVVDAPDLKAILGTVSESHVNHRQSALSCIAEKDGNLKFYVYNSVGWIEGDDVPEDFPATGFSNVSYEIMYYPHLIIASGKDRNGSLTNKAWDTMNGLTWILLTNEKNPFAYSEGASIVRYDNLLFLIGGLDREGNTIDETYFSKDNGVTWNDTIFFPTDYKSRAFSTLTVDKDKYMLLFGGKETRDGNVVNELWRGRINRFGFKED
jgi:hypothetical protein